MFRLRRKLNLAKMSKVSASCPAINEIHQENSDLCTTDPSSPQSDHSFESDIGSASTVSRKERIFALKSIRRERKREKDQQKKIQSNNISMDDFLSKQTEFKIWLKEEKSKQAKDLASPKLKTYFKSFIKHWNRKKLNQKYYRGSDIVDTPPPSSSRHGFIFTDDTCSNTTLFPQTINLSTEGSDTLNSPFSTFGKSPLGLPIPKRRSRGSAAFNTKLLPVREDDTGKENQQVNIQDETDQSQSQEKLHADSVNTSLHRSDSNLYKVSVLSWTSKGELTTDRKSPLPRSRKPKPVPPLRFPTPSEPDPADRSQSVPYKQVQDSIPMRKTNPSKQLIIPNYPDPGYADPDSLFLEPTKDVPLEIMKTVQSPPAIYAVPVKKKKMAAHEVNSYISMDMSLSPPPPIPLKRKSPLESWPYDNTLMGTNIPAPCYSMNKDLDLQQSGDRNLTHTNLQTSDDNTDRFMNTDLYLQQLGDRNLTRSKLQTSDDNTTDRFINKDLLLQQFGKRNLTRTNLQTSDHNTTDRFMNTDLYLQQLGDRNLTHTNLQAYDDNTDRFMNTDLHLQQLGDRNLTRSNLQTSDDNTTDRFMNTDLYLQQLGDRNLTHTNLQASDDTTDRFVNNDQSEHTVVSYMSRQAHLMPGNPETPPPQLVAISQTVCQSPTRLPLDSNVPPSHSKPSCNKYSVQPTPAPKVNTLDSVVNKHVVSQLPIPKSYMSRHLNVKPEHLATPPPQLVPIISSLSVDSNHSSSSKHCEPFASFKPLRYETTFSANDTESPIKTPCSVLSAGVPLTNTVETGHKASTVSLTYEQAEMNMVKENFNPKGHSVTYGSNTDICENLSLGSSKLAREHTVRNEESDKLTVASDPNNSYVVEIQSSASSQTEDELHETDIDELDSDVDDASQHSYSCNDTGRSVMETNLDEVLEEITQQKTKSTECLAYKPAETTV